MNKEITYIYLHSVEHSGSTLLACILGAHPAVSTVGEFSIDFSRKGLCSCGTRYDSCMFWKKWTDASRARKISFDIGDLDINLQPAHDNNRIEDIFFYNFPFKPIDTLRDVLFRSSYYQKAARNKLQKYLTLATVLCDMEGTRIFLDTSKNPYQVKFLSRLPGIQLKVISLVRDGRAVMNSLIQKEKYSPKQAIDAWMWGNKNIERIKKHYLMQENCYLLKLETLCNAPDDTKTKLFEFCGVDPNIKIDYTKQEQRHIVGNYMRHKFNGLIRKHDESWRTALSKTDLELFESKGAKMNRRYGYDD